MEPVLAQTCGWSPRSQGHDLFVSPILKTRYQPDLIGTYLMAWFREKCRAYPASKAPPGVGFGVPERTAGFPARGLGGQAEIFKGRIGKLRQLPACPGCAHPHAKSVQGDL